ncbi:hypothetical protein [Acinetobacter sp. YH12235]|uniref:hypothetical protein n=1 Tax=Acinetobacter sp. YH12235 TaxID=2601162 RepID=UPI0015D330DE|nr:hypothetical protein [Acinetobacter sp. YH12235]
MATDVDVQYFSHLNGLTLGNNWGDLIRLLDKALVTGIDFTQITSASIDAQGDVHITLYAAHNAMLLQVVELLDFAPSSLNQKYRIKGVPSATELILKPKTAITETSITTVGAGKLAPLGYEIIFRDTNDVKRVYRAKNPTAQHPYIRIDESLTSPDGTTGVYTPTYAKYAMVGLLEHMEHIDDYENPDVQQLPFDPANPAKNWKITGTGTGVVRGWSRWYWGHLAGINSNSSDIYSGNGGGFTLVGDKDAFYVQLNRNNGNTEKNIIGCGIYNPSLQVELPWFLMSTLTSNTAGTGYALYNIVGALPLVYSDNASRFFTPRVDLLGASLQAHTLAKPITPDTSYRMQAIYGATQIAPLEFPFSDTEGYLRGVLKHIHYAGGSLRPSQTTPHLSDSSMYVCDSLFIASGNNSATLYYLGELE